MRWVALWPVTGLFAGAAIGLAAAEHSHTQAWAAVVLTLTVGATLSRVSRWTPAIFLALLWTAFASGGCLLLVHAWRDAWRPTLRTTFDTIVSSDDALVGVITGTLRADAARQPQGVSLSVAVDELAVQGRASGRRFEALDRRDVRDVRGGILVSVAGDLAPSMIGTWRQGRRVRMPVRLRRPTRHLDPGVPDEERALARRGTTLVGTVKSGALVEMVAGGRPWTEAAAAVRARVRQTVGAEVGRFGQVSAGVVTAILIGDRAGLTPEVERRLQDAGTYHVIAISGGNIAILAAIMLTLFRWAGVLGRVAMMAAIVGLVAYGAMVQGGASVDRAVVMAVIAFLARAIDHRVDPVHVTVVAAGVLEVIDPLAVADPGFLLSFGATIAIVGVARLAPTIGSSTRHHALSRVARSIIALAIASVAAEVALLPVTAYFFGRVTLGGPLFNLVAVPAMGVVQMAGLLLVAIAPVSTIAATAVGAIAAGAAHVLVASAVPEWTSAVAWAVPRPSLSAVTAYYVAAACAVATWRRPPAAVPFPHAFLRQRSVRVGSVAVWALWTLWTLWTMTAAAIAFAPWPSWRVAAEERLRVTFLDVGQGDAALVQMPNGAAWLVDAGGASGSSYDMGERVVQPVLLDAGVRRLDTVVVTHPDADHVGGAASVVRAFRPFDVWEGVPVPRWPLRAALRVAAAERGSRWTLVQRDDRAELSGVQVIVHHPTRPDWERQAPRNDDSVVLELRWNQVSLVLAGDIGSDTEAELTERIEPARLRVLKVPHHGSLSSSGEAFLSAVHPDVAVISAGRGNAFGHPAPDVLARYESIGSAVFRTDVDGAVTVETDGARLDVSTFTGRRQSWP